MVAWDAVGIGALVGGSAGLWFGYQLRMAVEHYQSRRTKRATKRDLMKSYGHDRVAATGERREKPPVIPLKRSSSQRAMEVEQPIPVVNPWRDDVVAALVGAGYKKTDAVKAADACSTVERASGLEQWTIAALRNAVTTK